MQLFIYLENIDSFWRKPVEMYEVIASQSSLLPPPLQSQSAFLTPGQSPGRPPIFTSSLALQLTAKGRDKQADRQGD